MEAKLGTEKQSMFFDMYREGVLPLHIIRGAEIRNSFFVLHKSIGRREDSRKAFLTLMPYGNELDFVSPIGQRRLIWQRQNAGR